MVLRSIALVIAAIAYSASASACPTLSGHYTCTYDGQFGHHVFELDGKTSRDKSGNTMYVVNGKEVYTDGQQHHTDTLPILEQWADDVNYVGTCETDDRIHVRGDARVKKYGSRADLDGDLVTSEDGSLKAAFRVNLGFFGADLEVPCVKR